MQSTLAAGLAGIALLVGCGTEGSIRSRAAHELHCAEADVHLRARPDLTSRTYDVTACGRVARYTCARGYGFDDGIICMREPLPGEP